MESSFYNKLAFSWLSCFHNTLTYNRKSPSKSTICNLRICSKFFTLLETIAEEKRIGNTVYYYLTGIGINKIHCGSWVRDEVGSGFRLESNESSQKFFPLSRISQTFKGVDRFFAPIATAEMGNYIIGLKTDETSTSGLQRYWKIDNFQNS